MSEIEKAGSESINRKLYWIRACFMQPAKTGIEGDDKYGYPHFAPYMGCFLNKCMSANSQYIPLKNEYILHPRLNISPSAVEYIFISECSTTAFSTHRDGLIADIQLKYYYISVFASVSGSFFRFYSSDSPLSSSLHKRKCLKNSSPINTR